MAKETKRYKELKKKSDKVQSNLIKSAIKTQAQHGKNPVSNTLAHAKLDVQQELTADLDMPLYVVRDKSNPKKHRDRYADYSDKRINEAEKMGKKLNTKGAMNKAAEAVLSTTPALKERHKGHNYANTVERMTVGAELGLREKKKETDERNAYLKASSLMKAARNVFGLLDAKPKPKKKK